MSTCSSVSRSSSAMSSTSSIFDFTTTSARSRRSSLASSLASYTSSRSRKPSAADLGISEATIKAARKYRHPHRKAWKRQWKNNKPYHYEVPVRSLQPWWREYPAHIPWTYAEMEKTSEADRIPVSSSGIPIAHVVETREVDSEDGVATIEVPVWVHEQVELTEEQLNNPPRLPELPSQSFFARAGRYVRRKCQLARSYAPGERYPRPYPVPFWSLDTAGIAKQTAHPRLETGLVVLQPLPNQYQFTPRPKTRQDKLFYELERARRRVDGIRDGAICREWLY